MIDIRSHVIPEIDDGSPDIETSLNMVRSLAQSGVTDIICTPHYRKPYRISPEKTRESFEKFKAAVLEAGVNVNLYLGQEIYCNIKEYKSVLSGGLTLTMCGGKYVLLEFDFGEHTDIADVVYEVKLMGYIPIVAHIERYPYVTEDVVYEIKKLGGLIQVNADSVIGAMGKRIKKFVKKMFAEGFVDFVATDIHSGRPNVIEKAFEYVKKKFGADAAEVVFNANAKRVIKG